MREQNRVVGNEAKEVKEEIMKVFTDHCNEFLVPLSCFSFKHSWLPPPPSDNSSSFLSALSKSSDSVPVLLKVIRGADTVLPCHLFQNLSLPKFSGSPYQSKSYTLYMVETPKSTSELKCNAEKNSAKTCWKMYFVALKLFFWVLQVDNAIKWWAVLFIERNLPLGPTVF